MMKRKIYAFFMLSPLLWWVTVGWWPVVAWAQNDFDYNYILSDNDLFDYLAMSQAEIQQFLENKGSPLANYYDSITMFRADQIVYIAAQDFKISPKFLLALMQKEQSLIENNSATGNNFDWATGYAVCDGCTYDDPAIQKFKGFYNQVYNTAKKIRLSYVVDLETKGQTISGFGPGIAKTVDGLVVVPANKATAILYTYTPHLKGNRLLGVVWNRYFTRSYPDGTLLNVDGEREVWLIENGQRRKFANRSVYLSYYDSFVKVLTVNRSELHKYPQGQVIQFANYSYLQTPRGTVYLMVDEVLRGFSSRAALRKIGVNPEEIIKVKPEDIADYAEGQPITVKSVYPLGTLLQDKKSGGVYWVQDGVKHPIFSREILGANFAKRKINKMTPAQLAEFTTSTPILFPDGELVKSNISPAVYLISNKKRRPFLTEKAFRSLGFAMENVIVTNEAALGVHELGEPIGEIY